MADVADLNLQVRSLYNVTLYNVTLYNVTLYNVTLYNVTTFNLQVTVNGVTDTETETEVKQFGIYQLTSSINKSLDVSLFHPLTGIESGNIG